MIPLFKVHMPATVFPSLKDTLLSGYIGQGKKVEEFEEKLAPWFGSQRVVTVNSGTSAINLALRLAGVGPGDEVISTPMTCTATNMPILEQHADIVWADVNPETGNIDPNDVLAKITKKTKAIVCVHWGGNPCDLEALNRIADDYNIPIIEDAAHAFGSSYHGGPIGAYSRFVCFSFQAIKHLTTVDGGALVCGNSKDYERAKLLRWYGIPRKSNVKDLRCEEDIKEYGYKYHMNDVAATIGIHQLDHMSRVIVGHRRNAVFYDNVIRRMPKDGPIKGIAPAPDSRSSYWLYTIHVSDRDSFQEHMRNCKVMVSQVHVRNDVHTAFKKYRAKLPGVDKFSAHQVSIPVGWWVSDSDRELVARAMETWIP